MSDEQFNHIENHIKEAAESVEFSFDEYSWREMEKKLETGKDRKRFFIWFIPALLGALLLFSVLLYKNYYSVSGPDNSAAIVKLKDPSRRLPVVNHQNQLKENIPATKIMPGSGELENAVTNSNKKSNQSVADNKSKELYPGSLAPDQSKPENKSAVHAKRKLKQPARFVSKVITGELDSDDKIQNSPSKSLAEEENTILNPGKSVTPDVNPLTGQEKVGEMAPQSAVTDAKDTVKDLKQEAALQKKEPAPPKKRFSGKRGLYVLGSAGVDASNVKLFSFKNSPVALRYGIGIGYQLNRRWAVQTGFYVGAKKYIAGPADYKLDNNPYWNTVQIVGVDANCLIYEIPVTVRINIIANPKFSFYTSAGLSSYLMKKEQYDYNYIRYNTSYEHYYEYTGNKSFFGVLSLSTGIEKSLDSRFSLLAEPTINIPLSGVGEGKVKLYSFGLQAGIKYNFRRF